mmetsp:Transcript_137555/g.252945  ORF Transcript_137555/g.252945 Transcript_137555/m.252945 type:complete len:333 (+) Transcript_137555:118-1116(+)
MATKTLTALSVSPVRTRVTGFSCRSSHMHWFSHANWMRVPPLPLGSTTGISLWLKPVTPLTRSLSPKVGAIFHASRLLPVSARVASMRLAARERLVTMCFLTILLRSSMSELVGCSRCFFLLGFRPRPIRIASLVSRSKEPRSSQARAISDAFTSTCLCLWQPKFPSWPMSARKETYTNGTSVRRVTMASGMLMTPGEITDTVITNQKYAKNIKNNVTTKTSISTILRISVLGMTKMQIAMITSRLKEAEPTMVDGPNSPAYIFLLKSSVTDRRISGAEDPSAIKVRFATVSFHTRTVIIRPVESRTCLRLLVITSIAPMKVSAIIDTPTKK